MKDLLKNCDAILVTSDINRSYLTGFKSSAGIYFCTKDKNYFVTDFRYISNAKKQIKNAEVLQISGKYSTKINEFIKLHNVKTLGIEFDAITVTEFKNFEKDFDVKFENISDLIIDKRNIKTDDEIEKMIASQQIIDEVFIEICDFIKSNHKNGLTEKNISSKIVGLIYEKGAEGISFDPIVASGKNGASPHARPTDKKIVSGEFITMDFGAKLNGYCSDMTRTVAVGDISDEMKNIYNLVLNAQLKGIEFAKAGVKGSEIHNIANDYFKEHNMDKYFGHGFGHGLGLEVHEGLSASPFCEKFLPENMFVSAEPGLYIDDFCGVRIEDVLILKENGNIDITKSTKDLIIL